MIVLIAKLKILGKGILTEKSNQKGICGRKKALIIFLELGNFQNLLGNPEKK